MRLREKDLNKCRFCGWRIYKLEVTQLWYDMVHHEFHCRENRDGIHKPKED